MYLAASPALIWSVSACCHMEQLLRDVQLLWRKKLQLSKARDGKAVCLRFNIQYFVLSLSP